MTLPENTATNQEPSHKTRPDSFLLVALFSALLASGMALYLFWQNQQLSYQLSLSRQVKASPSPSPYIDPTSDWQVYSNPSYNFSFKYPLNYRVQERVKGFLVLVKEGEPVAQAGISFDMRSIPTKSSFESIVKELYDTMNISKTYTVQAGDNSWSVYEGEGKEGMIQGIKFVTAVILQNSKLIRTETIATSEYLENFNQILSTFKFNN